jgi:YVTN family beta-propeller protein
MMSRVKLCFVFGLLLFITSCVPEGSLQRGSAYKMPLGQEGEVIIYLQPLPQESSRLRFIISGISALRNDGLEIPLSLYQSDIKGADDTGRQKLLASGILPPGSYSGLSIQIRSAWVQTEEGEIALLVPEEPFRVDQQFEVNRQEASALFLALKPSGMITAGVRFTPAFSLASAGRPLINLVGFASVPASNTLAVFNKKTMQVVDVIATDPEPTGIVLDQFRARAYVAAARDDSVAVVDVSNLRVINRLKLNFKDRPVWLALTPDGRKLVAVNQGSNTVSIIDARSMIEIDRVKVGEKPSSAVMDPSGLKVYILNTRSKTISVVDLTQRRLAVTIAVEAAPLMGAFNREGNRLYVISGDWPYLTVIDRLRFAITQKIFIGSGAVSIRTDNQTGQIYIGKKIGAEIGVIDPFSGQLVDNFQIGGPAVFLTIDGQERTLLAALSDGNVLQKINLISRKPMAEIELSEGAYSVVVMGQR